MTEMTPRLLLPLLEPGQAQKEAMHNESIIMLDAIVSGMVETVGDDVPPTSPEPGQTWILGSTPSGGWSGHAHAVAVWTAGGWRFVEAVEGMNFRVRSSGIRIERGSTAWSEGALIATKVMIGGEQIVGPRLSGITGPSAGATIDQEARAAINAVLVTLRTHGMISS